tara:strand:- start:1491 stop:1727 length:237 start_codon:yes stop_codon:yes gene_type:complete
MGKMKEIAMMIEEVEVIKSQLGYIDPNSRALTEIANLLTPLSYISTSTTVLQSDLSKAYKCLSEIIKIIERTGRQIKQ